jgi:hypothetical protein
LISKEVRKEVTVHRNGESIQAYLIRQGQEERIVYPTGATFTNPAGQEKVDAGVPQPITVNN